MRVVGCCGLWVPMVMDGLVRVISSFFLKANHQAQQLLVYKVDETFRLRFCNKLPRIMRF